MVKTAHQLMWDKEFVEKRINEQKDYIEQVRLEHVYGYYSTTRFKELSEPAKKVLQRFERQLDNINKLK